MGKQIIFLLSVCLEMSCLSFFSPFPPHFLLNYPKFEVICPLPFSINHRWWEFDALLISGEPTFSLQDIFGRFFFLMSSDMKFQDNMSGFFNFFFSWIFWAQYWRLLSFFISAKWSSIIFYSISFVLSEILNLCLSYFCIFSFIVHRNYSNLFRSFIANFWQLNYFLRDLSWFWNFIAYHSFFKGCNRF